MRNRITRLSPHQNGKVAGVLMAIVSLVIVVPIALIVSAVVPATARQGSLPSIGFVLILPVLYLIFGYIGTALASLVYNGVSKLVGGFEFDMQSRDDE